MSSICQHVSLINVQAALVHVTRYHISAAFVDMNCTGNTIDDRYLICYKPFAAPRPVVGIFDLYSGQRK